MLSVADAPATDPLDRDAASAGAETERKPQHVITMQLEDAAIDELHRDSLKREADDPVRVAYIFAAL